MQRPAPLLGHRGQRKQPPGGIGRLLPAPAALPYINLFPNYASPDQLGTVDYAYHVRAYLETVQPPFLSYDHYSLLEAGDRPGYFANLEVVRYQYQPSGDLWKLTDGKSQTTTWLYDDYGRVTNKVDQASVEILRYAYDANSRLTNRWSKAKLDTKNSA